MKLNKKAMVGTLVSVRNLSVLPQRTNQKTLNLLLDVQRHSRAVVINPAEIKGAFHTNLRKAIRTVRVKMVQKRKTGRKHLERFKNSPARKRRRLFETRVQVLKKDTVPALRDALPKMYGQGFLRCRISVFPYRPMDTFLAQHKVNVYQNGSRFDVIDALCNIPILSGITRRHLKGVVAW